MMHALTDAWANPSSGHRAGRLARALRDEARSAVAALVGVGPDHVTFTSGATEALNHVVWSAGPGRVLASAVEHPAVIAAAENLGDRSLELVPVDSSGRVRVDELLKRVDDGLKPVLVAVMAANNVTGVLQPIAELSDALAQRGVPLLVDAVQLAGKLPVDFNCDYLVLTAHKLGGPKGVGALITKHALRPLVDGGGQESGRRGGTEPMPAIAGFGAAAREVLRTRERESQHLRELRDALEVGLKQALPGLQVIGEGASRLPNTSNVILPEGIEAEAMMTRLNLRGVCVSAGSACHTGSLKPSRVLSAMGLSPASCFRSLRLSLGHGNTRDDVDQVIAMMPEIAAEVRG